MQEDQPSYVNYWKTRALLAEQQLKILKRSIKIRTEDYLQSEERLYGEQVKKNWNTDMGR